MTKLAPPMKFITRFSWFPRALVCAAIFAAVNEVSLAKDASLNFLKVGKPDAGAVLPAPPLPGSAEQAADMATVKTVFHDANDADKNAAYAEKKFSVFNFAAEAGPFFVEAKLPKTAAFFKKVQGDAELVTDSGKNLFHRSRPYTTDPSLQNGKLEKTFSYPSGHSTESMVLALVLAELLPDHHDAIIAHARAMGWHRVQIARHYPTDIYAGRVLAQAIVHQFKKSAAFEKEYDDVKKEIEAAKLAGKN